MNVAPYLARTPINPLGSVRMSAQKTELKPRPYAALGERLRRRKEALIASGKLPNDLTKIAKLAGVSVSGFGQWERGETWPRKQKRANLATLMDWTEQELDFGPQPASEGASDVPSHPVSPDELEMLALYRGLQDEQAEVKRLLVAKLHARHISQQHIRGPLKPAGDTHVETRMPITKKNTLPGSKSRRAAKGKSDKGER